MKIIIINIISYVSGNDVIIGENHGDNFNNIDSIIDSGISDIGDIYDNIESNGYFGDNNVSWMSFLSNSTRLYELSIPGTHDSLALYGGPFKTQTLSLTEQLYAGIRAFDIRCRHISNFFFIYHGPVYQKMHFSTVLEILRAFLRAYPSEIILIRIKEEYRPERNTRSFINTLKYYLPNAKKYSIKKEIEYLRGEIIILSDFKPDYIYGIPWKDATIQDEYRVPTIFSIHNKWLKVKDHFELAKRSKSNILFVNFLSGTSAGAYPKTVAKHINTMALHWLNTNTINRTGIVFMDFPTYNLINAIIRVNHASRSLN